MMRNPAPLWLARPSRFAGLSPVAARRMLALVALLLLATLLALRTPGPPPVSHDPAKRAQDQADVVLYETIADGMRHGGDYYRVAAEALRSGNYPLRPFVTFRLPTLAVVEASAPRLALVVALYALAAAVLIAWRQRLAPAFARPPARWVAMLLLVGGMAAFVRPDMIAFHEVWAALFIALSLALRRPGRWVEAVAFGAAAMLIRETAALYALVMAATALIEGERREAAGWGAALGVLAVALALHAHAVAEVVRPLDPASPGWAGMLGFGFFVRAAGIATGLGLAPGWIAAPLVGLALVGWAAWRDPLAVRVLATLVGYALALSLFGRTDTFYWVLLMAPILPVGLAFAPDALRDLIAPALDTRRITVKRVVR